MIQAAAEEEKKGMRRLRWADCDDEEKENQEGQEKEEEREKR